MIRYVCTQETTNKTETVYYLDELDDTLGEWFIDYKEHSCKGCQEFKEDVVKCSDWYGIYTGHYCTKCYETNYPYKKERYPTIENDGYGERLEDDY